MQQSQQVNDVRRALQIIFEPKVSLDPQKKEFENAERRKAQELLDALGSSLEAPLYGKTMAHANSQEDLVVRNYGLGLIEDCVRFRWHMYNDVQQQQFAQILTDLLLTGLDDVTLNSFLRDKLAKVVVQAAKRLWPQRWNDLNQTLSTLYQNGSVNVKRLVLAIFQRLAEDLYLLEDAIAAIEKKSLTAALFVVSAPKTFVEQQSTSTQKDAENKSMLTLMQVPANHPGWLNVWTNDVLNLHNVWQRQKAQKDAQAASTKDLIASLINCLGVYAYCMPLTLLLETNTHPALVSLLVSSSRTIREATVEALYTFYTRNVSLTDENRSPCIVHPILQGQGFQYFITSWAMQHSATLEQVGRVESHNLITDETIYCTVLRFVDAYVKLGTEHVCPKKSIANTPQGLDNYLQFMLVLTNHPSILISSSTLDFWTDFLKHDIIKQESKQEGSKVAEVLPAILESFLTWLVIVLEQKAVTKAHAHYLDLDFETKVEKSTFCTLYRQRYSDIVKQIVVLKPKESFFWIQTKVMEHLSSTPKPDELHSEGHLLATSPWVLQLNALATTLNLVVASMPKSSIEDEQVLNAMNNLLGALVSYQTRDPNIVKYQLLMIAAYAEAMTHNQDLLFKSLEKLFSFITFTQQGEELEIDRGPNFTMNPRIAGTGTTQPPAYAFHKLRPDTQSVRIKAASSLVRLACSIPDTLAPLYPQIRSIIANLVDQGLVRESERSMLVEFALSIVYFSKNMDRSLKTEYWNELIEPIVQTWEDPNILKGGLSNVEAFQEFLGLQTLTRAVKKCHRNMSANVAQVDALLDAQIQETRLSRSAPYWLTHMLGNLLRRTIPTKVVVHGRHEESPWVPYISRIALNAFRSIKVLNDLWNLEGWQNYPQELHYILKLSPFEKRVVLGGRQNAENLEETIVASSLTKHLDNVRSWLVSWRDTMYTYLGLLTHVREPFYSMPGLSDMLLNGVFSSHVHLENRHWRSLIGSLMKPLIINCPPPYFDQVLQPVLPPFVTFFTQKLDKEWEEVIKRGIQADDVDMNDEISGVDVSDDDMSDELVNEKILRGLTENYADFLVQVFSLRTEKREEKRPAIKPNQPTYYATILEDFKYKDLIQYLAGNSQVFLVLLESICNLIRYPDTIASKKALESSRALIPLLARVEGFSQFLTQSMLRACLDALQDDYHFDQHGPMFAAITDIYNLTNDAHIVLRSYGCDDVQLSVYKEGISSSSSHDDQIQKTKVLLAKIVSVEKAQKYAEGIPKTQKELQKEAKKKLLSELSKQQQAEDATKTDLLVTSEDNALAGLFE